MKEIKTTTTEQGIEKALTMYMETVSPSKDSLLSILNQIPEKEKQISNDRRAIRSPYIWLAMTEMVALCFIVIAVFPTFQEMYIYRNDPFYSIDKQIESFEAGINNEDGENIVLNYNNNL